MINKEEIEKLEATIEDYKLMRLNNCTYEVEGEMFIILEKLLKEYKRQKENDKEHQKLNGELQEIITELEEKNDVLETNLEIANGEIQRIGYTLKLDEHCITDDMIDEIKKLQNLVKGKSIQELGTSDFYKED